jgi:hypothetical protein
VGKDEVISMAVVACGGNDKTAFEQTFTVNTLRVIAQNIMFWNVVDSGDWRSLTVTLAAENRDVHLVGAGFDVAGRKDVVIPMAFAAGGGIGCTPFQSAAVNTGVKFLICFVMTGSTVDFF